LKRVAGSAVTREMYVAKSISSVPSCFSTFHIEKKKVRIIAGRRLTLGPTLKFSPDLA
jgi:hypothetical protein